jgi:methylglutaconyl-CoA hydratase
MLALTLNRPEQRNAIDGAMYVALSDALDQAEVDPRLRVVSLAATGRHFSAGVDLAKLSGMLADPAESRANAVLAAKFIHRLATFPLPTVAAVQGGTHGGGVGLVLACDIVLAASDARFSLAEVRLGLFPGLVAPLFAAAVGRRVAARYLLTGDPFDAAEAQRIGVVHDVVAPESLIEALGSVTTRIATAGPEAVAATKRLLWNDRFRVTQDWDIPWITEEVLRHRASPQAAEGVRAFLEKRTPNWAED